MFFDASRGRFGRALLFALPVVLVCAGWLFAGCGDDDDGPTTPAGPTVVQGSVIKGAVSGATVRLHALATDGSPGDLVGGPWTTDATGAWSGEVESLGSGPFLLVAEGGSYVDEASGATVELGASAMIGFTGSGSGVVTPYTHALHLAALENASEPGTNVAALWGQLVSGFEAAFGFDPTTTLPSTSGTTAARTYQALLGGVSEFLDANPSLASLSSAAAFDLVLALAADLSDGALDGLDASGNAIDVDVGGSPVTWPALDAIGIDALIDAINAYAAATQGLGEVILGDVEWDFGEPTIGQGSGSLAFSGPGAALIGTSSFVPTGFSTNELALSWATFAIEGIGIQVGVTRASAQSNDVSIVSVTVQNGQNAYAWQVFDFQPPFDVAGISIDGTFVEFEGVVLPGTLGTTESLTLNGQLGP